MGRNPRNSRAKSRNFRPTSTASGRLAGVAAAIAVIAAAVFALGLELGGRKEAASLPSGDRLSMLDDADLVAPRVAEPANLMFHDALTRDRPVETLPPVPPKPVQVGAKPAARSVAKDGGAEAPTKAIAKAERPATGAGPVASRLPPGPAPRIENSTWRVGVGVSPDGRWAIQLGASPNDGEARRIAAKHPGARIVTADVDGKRWYRVRLAGFRSKSDAEAELQRLGHEEGVSGFVVAAR
jgi:septal ring-binding cell division protein DamX